MHLRPLRTTGCFDNNATSETTFHIEEIFQDERGAFVMADLPKVVPSLCER